MDIAGRVRSASPDEVLLELKPTTPRRIAAVGSVTFLGFLLVWLGATAQGEWFARLALVACGGLVLFGGARINRSSALCLELTPREFRDSGGEIICRIEEIERVDRGFAVFKPSNGFLIHTRQSGQRRFRPGLWWRMGRRIGIGGLTNAGQSKAAVAILQLLIDRQTSTTRK